MTVTKVRHFTITAGFNGLRATTPAQAFKLAKKLAKIHGHADIRELNKKHGWIKYDRILPGDKISPIPSNKEIEDYERN